MKHDLGQLKIDRLIVHEVPQRRASEPSDGPVLSDIESNLNQSLKNYFRERISGSFGLAAADVIFDPDSTSPVPQLVIDCLDGAHHDFVDASRQMAMHLYNSQTGVNPPGLLVVTKADFAGNPSLAILKLEREAGIRAMHTTIDGKATFDIEHIRQLMLTDKTRVFKVGLFWRVLEDVDGIVCDRQRGAATSRDVAEFFLKGFLGCQLCIEPDVTTREFFLVAQQFINKRVENPQDKGRYQIALLAEMSSGRSDVNPKHFAETHLDLHDRMAFQQSLEEVGLPVTSFTKDTALIESVLKRVEIDFESGIVVLAPPDSLSQYATMTDLEGGRTRLEIVDTISKVKGKS